MSIRWKRDPRETGLRAIGQGPRCWTLEDDQDWYMRVECVYRGPTAGAFGDTEAGNFANADRWYWVVQREGKRFKSKAEYKDDKEAKDAANAYWKKNRETIIANIKKPVDQSPDLG